MCLHPGILYPYVEDGLESELLVLKFYNVQY